MLKKIGLAMLCVTAHASAANAALQQLHKLLDPVHTLTANFLQSTTSIEGELISTAAGQLKIKRPGKFYWRTTQPGNQTIVINGKQLWLYDEDLQQVTQKKLSPQTFAPSPASLLSGDLKSLAKNNTLSLRTDHGQSIILIEPRSTQSTVHWIKLLYREQQLQALEFQNQLQQVTRIDFRGAQTNLPIPEPIFQFTIPAGVDLLSDAYD